MCPGLHGNKTSRYLLKYLFHRFRCRLYFLFQKDFARFIQNAVVRPAIAEVHTNRELVSFENHVSIYPNSANLFHCRSPFHFASSTSNIGSVSHPAGDRPSQRGRARGRETDTNGEGYAPVRKFFAPAG